MQNRAGRRLVWGHDRRRPDPSPWGGLPSGTQQGSQLSFQPSREKPPWPLWVPDPLLTLEAPPGDGSDVCSPQSQGLCPQGPAEGAGHGRRRGPERPQGQGQDGHGTDSCTSWRTSEQHGDLCGTLDEPRSPHRAAGRATRVPTGGRPEPACRWPGPEPGWAATAGRQPVRSWRGSQSPDSPRPPPTRVSRAGPGRPPSKPGSKADVSRRGPARARAPRGQAARAWSRAPGPVPPEKASWGALSGKSTPSFKHTHTPANAREEGTLCEPQDGHRQQAGVEVTSGHRGGARRRVPQPVGEPPEEPAFMSTCSHARSIGNGGHPSAGPRCVLAEILSAPGPSSTPGIARARSPCRPAGGLSPGTGSVTGLMAPLCGRLQRCGAE